MPWLVWIGPQAAVTLCVGLLALIGVLVTWRQKNIADRRSEWWRRTQWALEQTFSNAGNEMQSEIGFKVLGVQVGSPMMTHHDYELGQVIFVQLLSGRASADMIGNWEDENDMIGNWEDENAGAISASPNEVDATMLGDRDDYAAAQGSVIGQEDGGGIETAETAVD